MVKHRPIISIVIPTYVKSLLTLETPLRSIANQKKCPRDFYEVIVVDNEGGKGVKKLADKYHTKFIEIEGQPSQACRQINTGIKRAKGEYIMLVDHDVELNSTLVNNFINAIKDKKDIDAWIVPYKIVAKGKLLTKIRNFEEEFYKGSIIATPRIIRKDILINRKIEYDSKFNSGPGDWDFANQLREKAAKIDYLKNDYFYHHEEELTFWQFISKKVIYSEGGEVYKNKWKNKNLKIYQEVVSKQYDPFYRLFGIFVEKGKWKKLLVNTPLYLFFLAIKVTMAAVYFYNLKIKKLSFNF